MPLNTIFCTSPQLCEELGIDVRIIRDMCEKKIIPSEIYNGRYRILHACSVKIMTQRAEEFEGHYRPERSAVLMGIDATRERWASQSRRSECNHGICDECLDKIRIEMEIDDNAGFTPC